jgi:hypothetical protein
MDVFLRENGAVELGFLGKVWLRGLDLYLRRAGKVLTLRDFQAGPWREEFREGRRIWRRRLSLEDEEILEIRVREEDQVLRIEAEFLTEFSELQGSLDYTDPAVVFPVFLPDPELSYFLCTFGLDGAAGEFPGGYWPEARLGKVFEGFPQKPWAPLVLWGEGGALAFAPGELFLTSPFVPFGKGFGRALAGNFSAIPTGTVLSTWIAWGETPERALFRLGEKLKAAAPEKKWEASPLLSRLGYWNAYGSYYTELIHPMEERILLALTDEFRKKKIPVGYFGLDLWYPYERIGRAKIFRPDPRKYPAGLAAVREKTGLPFVLHLSALSKENLYGADGTDPLVYEGDRRGSASPGWCSCLARLAPHLAVRDAKTPFGSLGRGGLVPRDVPGFPKSRASRPSLHADDGDGPRFRGGAECGLEPELYGAPLLPEARFGQGQGGGARDRKGLVPLRGHLEAKSPCGICPVGLWASPVSRPLFELAPRGIRRGTRD